MFRKLRAAEWLIAIGSVMLFGATFQTWFTIPGRTEPGLPIGGELIADPATGGIGLNVWDLGFTRWFVYLAILCAAALVVAALFGETVHYAIVMATPTVLSSLVASVGLVARLIWPPGSDPILPGVPPYDVQIEPAFYVAVAGSLLIFLAGCWSIRSEYVPEGYAPAPEPERVHLDSAP